MAQSSQIFRQLKGLTAIDRDRLEDEVESTLFS